MYEYMSSTVAERAIDPVCGMSVEPSKARGSFNHQGTTYYFCSPGCRDKFASDPEGWLSRGARSMGEAPRGVRQVHRPQAPPPSSPTSSSGPSGPDPNLTTYTCPMHPEVVQQGPGSCPICGMALEPRTITAEEPENHELRDMS